MKTVLTIASIFLCAFISSTAISQEEESSRQLVPKNKIKQSEDSNLKTKLSTVFAWNSNLFRTPNSQYIDPSSGATLTNGAKSGFTVNPDLKLRYDIYSDKFNFLDALYHFDSEFNFGPKNASNANSMDNKLSFVSRNIVLHAPQGSSIEKMRLRTELYALKHDDSYFNRGDGSKRVTSVSQTNEEDRYSRKEYGIKLDPSFNFASLTELSFPLKYYARDYEEVGTLGSYDRKGQSLGLEAVQVFAKYWSIGMSVIRENVSYDSHKAYNSAGNTVNGTKRKYNEQTLEFFLKRESAALFGEVGYKILKRKDEYADYWSYDQNSIDMSLGHFLSKKSSLVADFSLMNRSYKLETAPNGAIRKRALTKYGLTYKKEHHWGNYNLGVQSSEQTDTDKYYYYKQFQIVAGIEYDF